MTTTRLTYPGKLIFESGRTSRRKKYDTDSFQLIGTTKDNGCDWEHKKDNADIVGGDTPMRIVELSPHSDDSSF